MRLDLTQYKGEAFDTAVSVFYAIIDDFTDLIAQEESPCGLTSRQLGEYRKQAALQAYSSMRKEALEECQRLGIPVMPDGSGETARHDPSHEPVDAGAVTVTVVPDLGRFRQLLKELLDVLNHYSDDPVNLAAQSAQSGS